MSKQFNVEEAIKLLPADSKFWILSSPRMEAPLHEFLKTEFLNFIKDQTTPEEIVDFVSRNLNSSIIKYEHEIAMVDAFVLTKENFIESVEYAPGEFRDIRDELVTRAINYLNPKGLINYCGKELTLEELYNKLTSPINTLQDKVVILDEQTTTVEEKISECNELIVGIEEEILDSQIIDMNITFRDYVTNTLPNLLVDTNLGLGLKVGEEVYLVEEVVSAIEEKQIAHLAEKKQKEDEERDALLNKTSDNPNLVNEIQVALKQNNIEVTAEFPVVQSSLPTEEENESLKKHSDIFKNQTKEEYYTNQLNWIKESIQNCTNEHDLEYQTKLFEELVQEIGAFDFGLTMQKRIESITRDIDIKKQNIKKVEYNMEEYIDAIHGEINNMMAEMNTFTQLDDYSRLEGKALSIRKEIHEKGIKDLQLLSQLQLLFKRISDSRLNTDAILPNQSPEAVRVNNELLTAIKNIKRDLLESEYNPNNPGNFHGTLQRISTQIEELMFRVREAYESKLLTDVGKKFYMNNLENYRAAVENEQSIGYGTR